MGLLDHRDRAASAEVAGQLFGAGLGGGGRLVEDGGEARPFEHRDRPLRGAVRARDPAAELLGCDPARGEQLDSPKVCGRAAMYLAYSTCLKVLSSCS